MDLLNSYLGLYTEMLTPDEKQLIEEIYQNAQKKRAMKIAGMPEVGIFWVMGKRVLIDGTSLNEAEGYADFKIHNIDHYSLWEKYQRVEVVPGDIEYDEVPRGRVVYNIKTRQFTMFADPCILKAKGMTQYIMAKMNLPFENTKIETDEHYRCPKCLRKAAKEEKAGIGNDDHA
jgi:hypothetical protein